MRIAGVVKASCTIQCGVMDGSGLVPTIRAPPWMCTRIGCLFRGVGVGVGVVGVGVEGVRDLGIRILAVRVVDSVVVVGVGGRVLYGRERMWKSASKLTAAILVGMVYFV